MISKNSITMTHESGEGVHLGWGGGRKGERLDNTTSGSVDRTLAGIEI